MFVRRKISPTYRVRTRRTAALEAQPRILMQHAVRKSILVAAFLLAGSRTAFGAAVNEQDIKLGTETGVLWGTLAYAAEPIAPAILMLPGSGPTDRNTNAQQLGLKSDAFKLLADGLAARGITSLRIDKRGVGESAGAITSETELRFQTYSDDARSWGRELRKIAGTKCVWMLGHSEGALVAEVAAQDNADICGLILLAGAGRKAGEIIREQLGAAPNLTQDLKTTAFNVLSELEAGRPAAPIPPQLMALFRPSVQPYMMSWLPLDPTVLLARSNIPVLIIQGDNDIQVSVQDAKLLSEARPDAKLFIVPRMNHVLKIAPPDRAANVATYTDPGIPLAPTLVDTIASFVNSHSR